jgi:cyclopropane-fatty-acyl-phospholipid synthase
MATMTRFDERLISRAVAGLKAGRLTVYWPDGRVERVAGGAPGPAAEMVVRDPTVARRIALAGATGLAEGYMDGSWDTPDLVALLDMFAGNMMSGGMKGTPAALERLGRVVHLLRVNTRRGSKRNIAYHYDLGNDFYRLWLDETLAYSCALFSCCELPAEVTPGGADDALFEAQVAKWDRLLDLLRPQPGEHMLEIGCGWGGFAIHAAQTRGCRVTGITLSEEQLRHAQAAVEAAGLGDVVEIRLQDYRDVAETFDHIASIEMFEAVGERYWPVFFSSVRDRLQPGGSAALQVITIADDRFDHYRRSADFIQKYIFPGGMLPSPKVFAAAAAQAGLVAGEPAFFAADYARTLECWLRRFDAVRAEVRALGFDTRFVKMWRYYLAYCIAGFRHEMIDDMQVTLTRA